MRRQAISVFLLLFPAVLLGLAAAPSVVWRNDSLKALEDARTSHRPIFIVTYSPGDPGPGLAVLAHLQADEDFRDVTPEFVLLLVAASSETAETLSLPPVVASSSAAVILTPEGRLAAAYGTLPSPSAVASDMKGFLALMLLDEAAGAVSAGNDPLAISLFARVVALRPPQPAIGIAREGLLDAGERGKTKIAAIEKLIAERAILEAKTALEAVAADYAGTDAARAASDRVSEMLKNPVNALALKHQAEDSTAAALLEKARALRDDSKLEAAADAYSQLLDQHPRTPAASDARQDLAVLRLDVAAMRKQAGDRRNAECVLWMSYADNFAAQGKAAKAAEYYRKIIDTYPDTPYARTAREKLAAMQ